MVAPPHGVVAHVARARIAVAAILRSTRRTAPADAALASVAEMSIVAVAVHRARPGRSASRADAHLPPGAERVVVEVLAVSIGAAQVARARHHVVAVAVGAAGAPRRTPAIEKAPLARAAARVHRDVLAHASHDARIVGAGDAVVALRLRGAPRGVAPIHRNHHVGGRVSAVGVRRTERIRSLRVATPRQHQRQQEPLKRHSVGRGTHARDSTTGSSPT